MSSPIRMKITKLIIALTQDTFSEFVYSGRVGHSKKLFKRRNNNNNNNNNNTLLHVDKPLQLQVQQQQAVTQDNTGTAERKASIYCVSQKNIPDIFSCNSRKHCRIFIMFGTHVTEKVSNEKML